MTKMPMQVAEGAGDQTWEVDAFVLLPDDELEANLLATKIRSQAWFQEDRKIDISEGFRETERLVAKAWASLSSIQCGADGWWDGLLVVEDFEKPVPSDSSPFGRDENHRLYRMSWRAIWLTEKQELKIEWRLPKMEYVYNEQRNWSDYCPTLSSHAAHTWWSIGETETLAHLVAADYARVCPVCGKHVSRHEAAVLYFGVQPAKWFGGAQGAWGCPCGGEALKAL